MALIYITGNAGAGKSTLCSELQERGYEAHDIDENGLTAWYDKVTGEQVAYPQHDEQRTKAWNDAHAYRLVRLRIEELAQDARSKDVFLCGQSIHDEEVWDLFDQTFYLVVDWDTLKHRLATRPGNVFGKTPGELAAILEVHESFYEKHLKHGAISIDGLQSTSTIADTILRHIDN